MVKKNLWLAVGILMAISLVMTACGQAPVQESKPAPAAPVEEKKTAPVTEEKKQETPVSKTPNTADTVKITLAKLDGTKVEKTVERPKYGGTYTHQASFAAIQFDNTLTTHPGYQAFPIYSVLIDGDPNRGPSGTNEIDWSTGGGNFMGFMGLMRGDLAESWTFPDDTTIRFKIRQGVHFGLDQNNVASRLVNGREITAADVVYSLQRVWDSTRSYFSRNMPLQRMQSVTAIDKYTIEMKILPKQFGIQLLQTAGRVPIIAHEVVEKYGDLQDWRNAVGSGPVMLTDYVAGSSMSLIRNPNYFEMDPWFPENRLPYVDGVKFFDIPDRSTQLAAMRTGKLDYMWDITWEEAANFQKNYPQVIQKKKLGGTDAPAMRMDKQGLPWAPQDDPNALRVRRAMNMAVNKQKLVDDYYGGNAVLFSDPWPDTSAYAGIFRPLSTYSKDVQELYQYNPEKAKRLLKEAGYPNGFKAIMTMVPTSVDLMSVVKDDLSKVGIELQFNVVEPGVWSGISAVRSYSQMTAGWNGIAGMPWKFHQLRVESQWTESFFDSPVTRAAYAELMTVLGVDDNRVKQIYASVSDVFLESAEQIWLPKPYVFDLWWPWLKRFDGAASTGTYRYAADPQSFNYYSWIDTALKKSMGY